MITVVSLHWKRTDNTHLIVDSLKSHPLVSEVIVWNNNSEVHLECSEGVRVVNSSDDFGLNTRFAAALLAANDCILTVDDDVFPHTETVNALFRCWEEESDVLHTLHGRTPTRENEYAMDVVAGNGEYAEAEISLTRCTMYHRKHAAKYFEVEPQIRDREHATPNNGEDIILSYIARSISGKMNRVYSFPSSELPAPHAIHGRSGHREYRTHLMRRCQKFFKLDR
jgi:hypothetical protein